MIIFILSSKKQRKPYLKKDSIPEKLGIQMSEALPIVESLENALTPFYLEQTKYRVLKDYPNWKEYEFEWTNFELKRYFLMNSLLKSVPMFSTKVDSIWHEMLMFTREYEAFSKNFYGELLHHIPNMEETPIPGERAFFDWVYLSLFELTPNSRTIWNSFLKNPIKREILDDFRKLSEEELLSKYFRKSQDWLEVKTNLIRKMKKEIEESDQFVTGKKKLVVPSTSNESQLIQFALGAAVFYSIYEEDQFQEQMSEMFPEQLYKSEHSSGGFVCSGVACSSSHDHHSDGGDSGGHSCSSCGGGCSSS